MVPESPRDAAKHASCTSFPSRRSSDPSPLSGASSQSGCSPVAAGGNCAGLQPRPQERNAMPAISILTIIQRSPEWVFVLFGALVVLGFLQSRTRHVPKFQPAILPVAFIGLSAWGIYSVFGLVPAAFGAWTAALAAVGAIGWSRPMPGVAIAPTGRLVVPGSWLPMTMILATFAARYSVIYLVLNNPALRQDTGMAIATGIGHGVLSGILVARAVSIARALTAARPRALAEAV
jgi:hypothetical protein